MTGSNLRYANPGPWDVHAACKGKTHLMDIPRTSYGRNPSREAQHATRTARALCQSCTVRQPCAEWALTDPDPAYELVAGGHTYEERNQMRRTRRLVPA